MANGRELDRSSKDSQPVLAITTAGEALVKITKEALALAAPDREWRPGGPKSARAKRDTDTDSDVEASSATNRSTAKAVPLPQADLKTIIDYVRSQDAKGQIHTALSALSARDRGVVIFRLSELALKNSGLELSRENVSRIGIDALNIKVTGQGYSGAFKRDSTSVFHVGGTKFRLNPPGRKFADDLMKPLLKAS